MNYYAGIDMAARSCHICVMNDDQDILIDQKVPNDFVDIWNLIEPFDGGIEVVVEASFNWYWIVDQLMDFGIPIKLAHPHQVKAITTAKVKTDRRDAFWLAQLLRGNLIPESHICPRPLRRLRDLCRQRFSLRERHGHHLRQIRRILMNEGYHTVDADVIAHLDIEGLEMDQHAKDLCYSEQRMQESLDAEVKRLDHTIITGMELQPAIKRTVEALKVAPGIGPVNGTTIVFESGNIDRFASHRPYISYARLTPGIAQSGESIKQGRSSKAGNKHLKRAFCSVAMHAVRASSTIRSFRDKHEQRRSSNSACRMICNAIVAHKMATGVFYMMKRNDTWKESLLFPC